jgi:hypothetical protein
MKILDNAVGMIIKTVEKEALPKINRWIFGVFAQRYNHANGRTGHFWEDRYISEILSELVESVEEAVRGFLYILRKIAKISRVRLIPPIGSSYKPPGIPAPT